MSNYNNYKKFRSYLIKFHKMKAGKYFKWGKLKHEIEHILNEVENLRSDAKYYEIYNDLSSLYEKAEYESSQNEDISAEPYLEEYQEILKRIVAAAIVNLVNMDGVLISLDYYIHKYNAVSSFRSFYTLISPLVGENAALFIKEYFESLDDLLKGIEEKNDLEKKERMLTVLEGYRDSVSPKITKFFVSDYRCRQGWSLPQISEINPVDKRRLLEPLLFSICTSRGLRNLIGHNEEQEPSTVNDYDWNGLKRKFSSELKRDPLLVDVTVMLLCINVFLYIDLQNIKGEFDRISENI